MLRFIPGSAGEQDRDPYSRMVKTDHPREVIEAAQAYVVRNRVEAAYARSDLFERRRVLMDDWSRDRSAASCREGFPHLLGREWSATGSTGRRSFTE